jgi:hypothetical protein
VAQRPERLGKPERLAPGQARVPVSDHHRVGAQVRNVGERVADEHAGRQPARPALNRLGLADDAAVGPRRGDEFVAADQGRDLHPRRDRPYLAVQDAQQQPGRPPPGLGEVDLRVGVVDDGGVGVPEHACRQDAVQVERRHDRHPLAVRRRTA